MATPSLGPTIRRHVSKQDYRTEVAFLQTVRERLGIVDFTIDLAADRRNRVTREYFSKTNSALDHRTWHRFTFGGWGWLNPPFGNIDPWAERCARTALHAGKVAFLVPAAVGSNWWRDYVHGHALVLLLNGRITFQGETHGYPKDLCLCLYGEQPAYEIWTWKPARTRANREVTK